MADFNRLVYHAVEGYMKQQLGPAWEEMDKYERRRVMADTLGHFAKALVAIVVQVSNQHAAAHSRAKQEEAMKNTDEAIKEKEAVAATTTTPEEGK